MTLFYLMIATGGALGGAFVALICPHVFSHLVETGISLIGGFLLAAMILLRSWWRRERKWALWWIAGARLPAAVTRDLTRLGTGKRHATSLAKRRSSAVRLVRIMVRDRRWWTYGHVLLPVPILAGLSLVVLIPQYHDRTELVVGAPQFLRRVERRRMWTR